MKVVCVAGARPNFMKVKPVVDALDALGAETVLLHTGQHFDPGMSGVFFDELGLREPDVHLGVGSGSHAEQTARVLIGVERLLATVEADVVAVVGDVNSTVGAAMAAAKAGCLVAHVEAGLRSRDWSMPEEINRVVTDRLSDYLFAPSDDAVSNLRREGYRDDQIHLVGNVMIDTLRANLPRAAQRSTLAAYGLQPNAYGLVTLHRPSNVDDPRNFAKILDGLGRVANSLPLIFPVHPRTRAKLSTTAVPPGIRLCDPAGYLDFLALEANASVVLTDSGGVQEETTALGVPCLTLRDNTERPITIEFGTNVLVGSNPDLIFGEAMRALDAGRRSPPALPAWDGRAGERIATVIMSGGMADDRLRPTALSS